MEHPRPVGGGSTVTEIVFTHKLWESGVGEGVGGVGTGAYVTVAGGFIQSGGKRPHVFSRCPTSDTHTIDIVLVYCDVWVKLMGKERVGRVELVTDDTTANPGVSYSDGAKKDRGAPRSRHTPSTGPDWTLDKSEIPRTRLGHITHVQISHPHPATGINESTGHVTVDPIHAIPSSNPVVA